MKLKKVIQIKHKISTTAWKVDKISRPKIIKGITIQYKTVEGTLYVTVNWDDTTQQIIEIIPIIGHSGQIPQCWCNTVGKISSSLLKRNYSPYNLKRMLKRQQAGQIIYSNGKKVKSVPYAIGLAIEETLKILEAK